MKEIELAEVEMLLEEGFEGVYAVSLVDKPAIQSDFIYLSAEKVLLKVIDEEKRIVTGALLIPELRVKRIDPKTKQPYNIFFTKETISALSEKFMRDHNQSNITLEHSKIAQNIDIVESWIKMDEKADKSVALGIDVSVGSWLVTAKINNEEIWKEVKKGSLSGFSIEAQMQRRDNVNFKKEDMNTSLLKKLEDFLTKAKGDAAEVVEQAEVKEAKVEEVKAEEAPAGDIVPDESPADVPEEEKTYVTVEEFTALEDKYREQSLVLEAIVDFLGKDFSNVEPEVPVEQEAELAEVKPEEKLSAIEESKEEVKEEEEKVEFVALPKESEKSFKLEKFNPSLTVAERIAMNFKNK